MFAFCFLFVLDYILFMCWYFGCLRFVFTGCPLTSPTEPARKRTGSPTCRSQPIEWDRWLTPPSSYVRDERSARSLPHSAIIYSSFPRRKENVVHEFVWFGQRVIHLLRIARFDHAPFTVKSSAESDRTPFWCWNFKTKIQKRKARHLYNNRRWHYVEIADTTFFHQL